ncbi:MAG: hypothetical protein QHC67_13425 [Sphingobium sp.]|uniref:hypothetical protein n=1 Tax=Sphingobium sp. TaxID=1912891 RepID=UPI0029B3E6C9|nr:hypothetical protein [Sphingobium sp.]MDX3910801.1 hypothetical protein [Sphingobium sp.]
MQDDDCNALNSALFALLTAKFEDAAAFAVEGQDPRCPHTGDLVVQVRYLAEQAIKLIDAIDMVDNSRS